MEEVNEWPDAGSLEFSDWRESSPLANAYVDLVLLAVIRAHPMQTRKNNGELARLRDAKEAVFGIKPRDDLKSKRDINLLQMMGQEYVADRNGGRIDGKTRRVIWGKHDEAACRKILPIARSVVEKVKRTGEETFHMVEDENVAKRLARKFSESQDQIVHDIVVFGEIETSYMVEWIREIRKVLGPFNIPVHMPQDPVEDLKHLF